MKDFITGKFAEYRNYFLFFLYLQLFPSLAIWFAVSRESGSCDFLNLATILLMTLIVLILFLAAASLGPPKAEKTAMLIFCVVAGVFNFAELFFFLHFQTQVQLSYLTVAGATNWTEVLGFAHLFLLNWKTLMLMLLYPGAGLLLLLFRRRKKFFPAAMGILLLGGAFLLTLPMHLRLDPTRTYRVSILPMLLDEWILDSLNSGFVAGDLAEVNADLKAANRDENALYILVIGESHSKYRSSLYGYPRDTMPRLSALRDAGELFVFEDVTAPHSLTHLVLPKLLTFEAHDTDERFFETPNIIDIMRAAGFRCYYLTNQANLSELGTGYMAIAARANEFRSTNAVWRMSPDSALYPFIDEALADPAPKKFLILHLIGNHSDYAATYPAELREFPLDSAPEFFNPQQKQNRELVNHYDNSLHFGDSFLAGLIGKLRESGQNGYLLYLSDHGENLYEEKDAVTHSEFLPTRQTVEIPMLLYLTESYRAKMPPPSPAELLRGLRRPWGSEDLPHLLLELSRVEFEKFDPAKSPVNPAFQPKRRIVNESGFEYEALKNATREERLKAPAR